MKALKLSLLFIVALLFIYLVGPSPASPDLNKSYQFDFPTDLKSLEQTIKEREANVPGIKKDNEAKFIWNDSIPTKTSVAFLYLHGFSASQVEGDPVHRNLAKKYNGNLFLARVAEHGIELGDETMATLTADKLIASAEEALAITKLIGQRVIIIGTSAGGALTTYLASKHPEIEAILLYSPCIEIFDPNAKLLDNPWGLEMAKTIQGKDFNDINPKNETQPLYWSMHYRLEALVALQNFITETMNKETFSKITCPTLLAYYFEDEDNQDNVVSVAAMLEMYDQLGTENGLKQKSPLPTTRDHVIGSYVMSEDWEVTQEASIQFLDNMVFN